MLLVDRATKVEMLRRMVRIRKFEEKCILAYRAGHLSVAHTGINQEACEVGCIMALREDDYLLGTHRAHGHPLAKGADSARQLAELLGKRTGFNGGKGGSMHMSDFSIGCLGENSIVGACLPLAVGAALGSKFQKACNPKVTMACFGDGASCEGTFHEALNMAALYQAPVVFVVENNGYQVANAYQDMVSTRDVASRAAYYGIPGEVVDGQDPLACYEAAHAAVMRAARGEGPTLIECKTMRSRTHGETLGSSDGSNRGRLLNFVPPEAKYFLEKRDCVKMFEEKLIADGTMTREEVDQMEADMTRELDEAYQFAEESPYPEPEDAFTDVYAN